MPPALAELAEKYGTDKFTLGYCPIYEEVLEPLRSRAFAMLEIGVFLGASIKMWLDYFPDAHIYGLDNGLFGRCWNFPKTRVTIFLGEQASRGTLRHLLREIPSDLAFILDDGGHRMWDQQVSLGLLFAKVEPGGVYIIEDLYTSFQPLVIYHLSTGLPETPFIDYAWATGSDFPLPTTYEILSDWPNVKSPYLTDDEWSGLVADVEHVEIKKVGEKSIVGLVFKKGGP